MARFKQFLVTLKSPIQVHQRRLDQSPILLKTASLLVEWPLSDTIEDKCSANTCGHADIEICRQSFKTEEATLIDVTVTAFVLKDDRGFWQSPFREDGCEPFKVQIKRDNVLSRQSV